MDQHPPTVSSLGGKAEQALVCLPVYFLQETLHLHKGSQEGSCERRRSAYGELPAVPDARLPASPKWATNQLVHPAPQIRLRRGDSCARTGYGPPRFDASKQSGWPNCWPLKSILNNCRTVWRSCSTRATNGSKRRCQQNCNRSQRQNAPSLSSRSAMSSANTGTSSRTSGIDCRIELIRCMASRSRQQNLRSSRILPRRLT